MDKNKSIEISCLILLLTTFTFIFASGKIPADDGFFYLEVAKNFVDGKGLHFNSLYETNGFHPLWGLICILIAYINPFGHYYLIFLIWLVQLVFFYQGIRCFKKYWENQVLYIIPLTILIIIFCSLGTIYLSEAFLNFFALALIFRFIDSSNKSPIITGFIFSLIFLSRLDNVFILLFLGIYICFIHQKFTIRYFIKMVFGFSVLVIPYLTFNYIEFGSIVPVSGKIKSFFPHFEMGGFNNYAKVLLVTTIIYLVGLITIYRNRYQQKLMLFFVLGTLTQLVYNSIFQSQIGQWYFIAQFIVLAFLCYDLADHFFNHFKVSKRGYNVALAISFILCLSISILKLSSGFTLMHFQNEAKFNIEFKSPIEHFVADLKENLPSDARIYVYDIPGKIAYYSNFDVIPGDGLINSEQFSVDLNKGSFEEYLINNRIDYVMLPSDSKSEFPLTKFLAVNTEIKNGKQRVEIKDPYQKKVLYEMNMSKYKEVMVVPNPLYTWQRHYDLVKIFQIIK